MTSSHIFYIPLILIIGFVLGIVVGRRSAELQREEEDRKKRLQAKRQKADSTATTATAAVPPE